jgi:hypothetical protein
MQKLILRDISNPLTLEPYNIFIDANSHKLVMDIAVWQKFVSVKILNQHSGNFQVTTI